ncbi:hypothetical protein CPB86DRAFT_780693 [Serendipita vermifera]|nr:hypothetical protein CPB86DRAFT_780693 [Serendipita vermifera]
MASIESVEQAQRSASVINDAANEGASPTVGWPQVETEARTLANALRSKDLDLHSVLGRCGLPAGIVALLRKVYKDENTVPSSEEKLAAFELLRLTANLSMDHDVNRQHFVDAKFHETIVSIIKLYTTCSTHDVDDLKVAKTAVGAILNTCFGYAPARSQLLSLGAPKAILQLSSRLYLPGKWATPDNSDSSQPLDSLISSYQIRIGLSDWSWRVISTLGEPDEGNEMSTAAPSSSSVIGVDALPLLVSLLSGFTPSSSTSASSPLINHPESRSALIEADLESLEECVPILEGLSLDSEEVRLAFIHSVSTTPTTSSPPTPILNVLLDFIEFADYPAYWSLDGPDELKKRQKTFDICKAGAIKSLVSIASEEKGMEALWSGERTVIKRLAQFVTADSARENNRDDLIIAGCLALGNLSRKDQYSEALLQPPYSLGKSVVPMLTPEADIKVKHAITGLLKNLCQAIPNRRVLGQEGLLEKLSESTIWREQCDMAETVQVSAIGIAKHLCNGDAENTLRLTSGPRPNGAEQILALVSRSDSIIVKSEGTRVLAYCVKSLWKKDGPNVNQTSTDPSKVDPKAKEDAMKQLAEQPTVQAIVNLLVGGQKHAILLNESIFALTLVATKGPGAQVVKEALSTSVSVPQPQQQASVTISSPDGQPNPSSSDSSPTTTTGSEVLRSILVNDANKFQPELRANACSLVGTIGRTLDNSAEREGFLEPFKSSLKGISENKDSPEKLAKVAKWALNEA